MEIRGKKFSKAPAPQGEDRFWGSPVNGAQKKIFFENMRLFPAGEPAG
jgi:hypothetical protein